ncbi:hypothetical protein JXA80_02570 [bacterium]|nr:hypothetical protein [candidate division CSSED10-310 bacterium]
MILFTKIDCGKCDYVKNHFDLVSLGVQIDELSETNADALADLAFYELVDTAEKQLPILITDDERTITGAIRISQYLRTLD